jgi:hypothetical protein
MNRPSVLQIFLIVILPALEPFGAAEPTCLYSSVTGQFCRIHGVAELPLANLSAFSALTVVGDAYQATLLIPTAGMLSQEAM